MIQYETRFDVDTPVVSVYKAPSFGPIPEHLHRHVETQYILDGIAGFTVDGKHIECGKGLIFIFPYQIHSSDLRESMHYSAIINPNAFAKYLTLLFETRPEANFIPESELPPFFGEMFSFLFTESSKKDASADILSDISSLIISCAVSATRLSKINGGSTAFPSIGRIISYITAHINEDLSLDTVSDALFIDKFYISKLCRAKLGIGYSDFVTEQRVLTACDRLRATHLPVMEIAYDCGFRNQSSFNRAFREKTGTTPREWRQSVKRFGTDLSP